MPAKTIVPSPPRLRRGRRAAVLAAGLVLAAAALAAYELSAAPWRRLARELGDVPPAFYLPLDTEAKGMQTGLETDASGQAILWGYGPESRLRFATYAPMRLRLCYAVSSPVRGQGVAVAFNGQRLAGHDGPHLPDDAGHPVCHDVVSTAGENVIRFGYRRWNHGGDDFAAADARPLAASFTMLQLLPAVDPLP